MRTSLKKAFRVFLFIFAPFAVSPQSLAQDNTNAAKIDLLLWGDMYQVMAGNSTETPLSVSVGIVTPKGIYARVAVENRVADAKKSGINADTALKNYFTLLLNQPYVSGILFAAPWSLLNPNDPAAVDQTTAYDWSSLDDAFEAIDTWNSSHKREQAKTLQLDVNPGFNSPPWLFPSGPGSVGGYLTSCDFLFTQTNITQPIPSCGYTTIFVQTEVGEDQIGHAKLPLPWNSTYQAQWKKFLTALNNHIQSKPNISDFVSIAVAGRRPARQKSSFPMSITRRYTRPCKCPRRARIP
jgi:hypothetical protein